MTQPPHIVPHKLRAPNSSGLRRTRLESQLLPALDSGHALVVAPPGAGKTTLLSQVAEATGYQVAWYSAGAEESEAAVLVRYLARALSRDLEPAPDEDASVDALLADIGDGRRFPPLVLVIDDLHELSESPAEHALARFLECCPPQLHVLLGSRRPPGFNAPRMMASGRLTALDGDDLRFRSWEVEELFRDLYSEPLSPEGAALLTRRVGGFAAALQLFHLSTRGRSRVDREAQIRQLSGRSPLLRSYLTRTVLDSLSSDRRDFLIRTSVLDVLHAALCDALLGRTDSATVLRELARDQLFTTSDDGVTYHYHQVLRDHLAVTLEDELPPAEVTGLHLRAAELLERAGHSSAALLAYQRAGDWGSAGRLLRHSQATTQPHGTTSTFPGMPDDPWLGLARARGLIRSGSIEAGLTLLMNVERSVDDADLVRLCAQERRTAALWQPGPLRVTAELASSPLGLIRALTQRPAAALPGATDAPITAAGNLVGALSKIMAGEFASARGAIEEVTFVAETPVWVRLTADLIDVVLELTEADDRTCGPARMEDLALTADLEGYPWLARLARGIQACVLLEQSGELSRRHACDGVIDNCLHDQDRWGELLLRILTGVTLARLGEIGDARVEFESAASRCRELDAPAIGRWVQGYLEALRGPRADHDQRDRILILCADLVQPRTTRLRAPRRGAAGTLRCLGGFQLLHGEASTDLASLRPQARLLLMRLAIEHGTDIHREHLIDALWPDAGLPAGLRRLQVAVSSIRQFLDHAGWGVGCLVRQGDAYRLQLPGVEFDVQQLEATITEIARTAHRQPDGWVEQQSAALIELYRGELLPETGAAEWVLSERDRLRLTTASALATLSDTALRLGRADLARTPAQRLVEIDPFRDTAWLTLARIQRILGDRNAAEVTLAAYHRVSAQLHPT